MFRTDLDDELAGGGAATVILGDADDDVIAHRQTGAGRGFAFHQGAVHDGRCGVSDRDAVGLARNRHHDGVGGADNSDGWCLTNDNFELAARGILASVECGADDRVHPAREEAARRWVAGDCDRPAIVGRNRGWVVHNGPASSGYALAGGHHHILRALDFGWLLVLDDGDGEGAFADLPLIDSYAAVYCVSPDGEFARRWVAFERDIERGRGNVGAGINDVEWVVSERGGSVAGVESEIGGAGDLDTLGLDDFRDSGDLRPSLGGESDGEQQYQDEPLKAVPGSGEGPGRTWYPGAATWTGRVVVLHNGFG